MCEEYYKQQQQQKENPLPRFSYNSYELFWLPSTHANAT